MKTNIQMDITPLLIKHFEAMQYIKNYVSYSSVGHADNIVHFMF